ncbi:FKBP-type peptidyl-prolyl cis-trans isomerase [Polaribacter sp. Z022]|uniref:FKBP-type peptidyl-prolyl cis-trans isomerase n=1 Tax=Polaribacter sp. Z022 TaxID=2927125 RepID=UPI0020226794|nr:FKBP-type peptidyl-prolyl cis-trans isomerase [Polaribacter sp. Z022]MCL7753448.1 FKBP-type peptidyl-prolyl cis-trans isomerase [Polaribacter sp. Z022]
MRIIKSILSIAVVASMVSCGNQVKEVKSLETEIDSVSYAIGLTMSSQLKTGFDEVNTAVLTQAIRNGLDSTNLLLENKDVQNVIRNYFQKKQLAKQKEALAKSQVYKKEGVDFLEANKSKEGVVTTASGLQYIVLKEGKGKKPTTASRVKVHYHGTLLDGTVFDSSVDKGTPAEFGVTQVIKGWTEGLQLMNVGSKYKFFIPEELAYGANPRPGVIKPLMALVFEVELLEIK